MKLQSRLLWTVSLERVRSVGASVLSCSVLVSVPGSFSGLVYGLGIRSARGAGMRVQRLVMPDGSGSWTVPDDLEAWPLKNAQ